MLQSDTSLHPDKPCKCGAHMWEVIGENGRKCRNCKTFIAIEIRGTDTATALAKQHGVSRATVIRDGKRAEALDKLAEVEPEKAQAVRDDLA